MRRLLGAWAVGALVAWGCGSTTSTPGTPGVDENTARTEEPPPTGERPPPVVEPPPVSEPPEEPDPIDPGEPDPDPIDPGEPDPDPGPIDPGNPDPEVTAGPWPDEPVVNYSSRYGLGSVQAVAVDDAYNIWLLHGDRIGVLRAGDTSPRWTSGVGQAAPGFGPDKLALGSTVICGGSAGRAYVGYHTYELDSAFIYSPDGSNFPGYNDPDPTRFDPVRYQEYQKGDLDVVKLQPDGSVALETHLGRSARSTGPQDIGIRNTNDHHFDEDRSVLSCTKVMRGKHKGQVYIGTNHGVTRIQGLTYNSHRHPVWFKPKPDGGVTQMAGYSYALGIAQNGDVLIGNDWSVGVVTPSENLVDWDRTSQTANPEKLNSHLRGLNSEEEKDYWRGIQQTADGLYYLASKDYGLWQMSVARRSEAFGTKVAGLPTDRLSSLAATDDGSLFIGTEGFGLWRLDGKKLTHVAGVDGTVVEQLLYDPTVKPAMLYVLTNRGLTVIRGH
ncbi:hypothetical protein [Archangium lansingense]|uniref:Uncharacterized protein n=1 Tax=Archangium lansingense TaxID=2995310 RepID=A0ABT4AN45_9BACT|nr:hypothetical protein [Archangium lansinium]MCY1082594.1 hypothetical protein [Archangium lansinium]